MSYSHKTSSLEILDNILQMLSEKSSTTTDEAVNSQSEDKKEEVVKSNREVDDHGYTGKSLRKKCECEMCQKGLATSHNDDSHDQSLLGQFVLQHHSDFKLQLIGGSTKCGRVMANYFASIAQKENMFEGKNILE
ncbi:hypothetical protein RFI_37663, partial [Reticulomyxa filosa]